MIAPSCEDQEMGGCWAGVRFFVWPRLAMSDPLEAIRGLIGEVSRHYKLARARIGYEGSFECVAPSHNAGEIIVPCESSNIFLRSLIPSARWFDATSLLHELRATKTAGEIARLRMAQRVAGFGLEKFHESVEPGMTEAEIAASVYTACLTRGAAARGPVRQRVSAGFGRAKRRARVATGRHNRQPAIARGEVALLELGVCVDGFWADVTRVKAAGKPSSLQRDVFAAVKAAQRAATAAIAPGVEARVPHEAATAVLVEAGFEKYVVHLTGHGLGFRYHEPEPFLMPGNTMKLKVGHVCSVEPGLYGSTFGGIRLEDNIAVTADGVEVLTKTAKTI